MSTAINEVPYYNRMDEDMDFAFADTEKYAEMWEDAEYNARKVTSRIGFRPRRKDIIL